jgi:hypothetical protein
MLRKAVRFQKCSLIKQRAHVCTENVFRNIKATQTYEDETFFVAQMFEENWQPRDSIIDYDDGTINDVPLRSYG